MLPDAIAPPIREPVSPPVFHPVASPDLPPPVSAPDGRADRRPDRRLSVEGNLTAVDSNGGAGHAPVLPEAVVSWLRPRPGGRYVDATFGRGGHARRILGAAPGARLLGIDRDPDAREAADRLAAEAPGFSFRRADFARLDETLQEAGWAGAHGILADLGVSSPQLEDPSRGFSFRRDGPLDMRFDPGSGETAGELLDRLGEDEIADLLHRFGEWRSRAIARRIAARRPIATTGELRAAVIAAVGPRRRRTDPATRTFLAVRSEVNAETRALSAFLEQAPRLLVPGGRLVVIAYHSEEDRLAKHRFRALAAGPEFTLPFRRPERPDDAETARNPRSRSARLRVLERVSEPEP